MNIAIHDSSRLRRRSADRGAAADRLAQLLVGGRPGVGVVGVANPFGADRTKALDECAALAHGYGTPVLRGRVDEQGTPYAVFADMFGHAVPHQRSFTEVGQDTLLLLRGLFRALRGRDALRLDEGEYHRLHRVICALVASASGPAGLVLLLDDLHLADDHSLALLDHLSGHAAQPPVFLVLGHDPLRSPPSLAGLLATAERHAAVTRLAPMVELPMDQRERHLTQRELTVLAALAEGLTADAIARRLAISPRTVHQHLQHLYRKLGTTDRLATVLRSKSLGLLP